MEAHGNGYISVEPLEQSVKEEFHDDGKEGLVVDSVIENIDSETDTEVICNSAPLFLDLQRVLLVGVLQVMEISG